MSELDKPMIFIFNFGRVLSNPALDALANEAEASWICHESQFTHENPHAKQVRHALKTAFAEISAYVETGVFDD